MNKQLELNNLSVFGESADIQGYSPLQVLRAYLMLVQYDGMESPKSIDSGFDISISKIKGPVQPGKLGQIHLTLTPKEPKLNHLPITLILPDKHTFILKEDDLIAKLFEANNPRGNK